MAVLKHRGYVGSVELSIDDEVLFGKLQFIDDLVTYEATDIAGLKAAFEDAVEDYVETRRSLGREPSQTCKGSFNVRIPPELHKALATKALEERRTLNDIIKAACYAYVDRRKPHALDEESQCCTRSMSG